MHDIEAIIAEIDERGYCCVPNVISPERADAARSALHLLLREEMTDADRQGCTQRVGRIVVKDPLFLELMSNTFVVDVWKAYLGDDIMCATFSANTVYPGHANIGWHSDYPYSVSYTHLTLPTT